MTPRNRRLLRTLVWFALTALAAAAFLAQVDRHEPRQWDDQAHVELEFEGERYRLDGDRLSRLERFSLEWLEAGDEQVRAQWQTRIDHKLDQHFQILHDRVPEVADWYFSLGAEYQRLLLRGAQWLGTAEDDAATRALRDRLLPADLWDGPLQTLAERAQWGLDEDQRKVRDAWRIALTREMADARVPATPAALQSPIEQHARIERAQQLASAMDADLARLEQRAGLAATAAAGTGLATPLIARAVQARLAAQVARSGGAALTRAGRAGALGAGVCAWSGPVSLGCGIVAAGAAWVGTDWVLLRIDEARHREDLEAALHEALDALHTETRLTWQQAIAEHVEARHSASREAIDRTFQPWKAALNP
ncbi:MULTISPECIES: hypothetical protein [unclassified Thioalkalivibrio]|uniref:hypothetical protein n=1 Tax=unclassified Thioalkalivibrio TaxID=2621013 RepID=UPI00037498C2|nr:MULTISPECIES: hypothetical protein [unclassified Thioalkalivibrio]